MRCEKCGVGGLMWANPFKTMPKEVICDKCKAAMSDIKRYTVDMKLREFGMVPGLKATEDGEVVLYEDHLAALEAVKGTSPQDHEARIKALEENPLENHMVLVGEQKTLFMHKPVGELLQALVDPLRKRIEGLEKALNEHMVKERECKVDQRDYISRLGVIQDAGYSVIIDPKASPKGIPFEVALAYLKAGRKIQRRGWNSGAWYFMDREHVMFHPHGFEVSVYPAQTTASEVLANDWRVIPQP